MERLSTFLRCLACIFAILFTGNAIAAGYTCDSYKKYTSCASGYYMVANSTSTACNTTAVAGNRCIACSNAGANYTCSGGTACPKLNSVTCSAGQYLPANATSCSSCKAGYKCPSTSKTYNVSSSDQGLTACSGATEYQDATGATSCKSVSTGYYKNGNTAQAQCPSGYRVGAGASSQNDCVGEFSKSGNQLACSTPSNCASVTCGTCDPGTCNYKKNYKGTITSDCTPSNCTKPVSSVTANAKYYVNGTSCSSCPAGYPNSDSGNSGGITKCYSGTKSRAWTGTQTACSAPSGCATVQCNSCSNSACDYVAYANTAGTGDGTIKSGCSTNAAACQQTVKSVTAKANYYVSGTSCPACSSFNASYTKSDGGNISSAYCYKDGTKTGSQLDPALPTGCATRTTSACIPGTCTYKDYYSATDTTCTPTNCTKSQTCTSASANYFLDSGTAKHCNTIASGGYPKSDGGNITSANCYKDGTKTGSQVNGSTPSGCASVTAWNSCSPGTCTYKDYYTATDGTCTPSNCTKTPKTVTANANYYVNGAACSKCPTEYPSSDGGSIGEGSCYVSKTNTGSQVNGSTPSGCASVTAWNSCNPGTCTWRDYKTATDTSCTPTNCTKTPKTVTASAGHYVSGATCPGCASGYTSAAGNTGTSAGSTCYIAVEAGKYLTTANGTATASCANWTYKAAHNVYQGSTSSCDSCPGLTNGWTKATGTGWTAVSSCVQTQTPANCASGTVKQVATSGSAWGSTQSNGTLSAKANFYVSGLTCSGCPSTYPKSDGGNISDDKCYVVTTETKACTDAGVPAGCESATYTPTAAQTCTWNKYKDNTGTKCTPNSCTNPVKSVKASAGYFASATATSCTACPAGGTSAAGATANTQCYKTCSAISINNGKTTVVNAKENYNGTAYPACTYNVSCNSGYGAAGNKTTSPTCTQCKAGNYSAGGTATCAACGVGTYSSTDGASSCSACSGATQYQNETGKTSCKTVDTGYYKTSNSGQDQCPAGSYCTGGTKTACPTGKFTNAKGQTSCTSCTGSTYQDSTGQTSCKSCPTAESGWTLGTGTGWTAVTSCFETQTPANCASGEIKKVGASATTWGSASVSSTLSANANAYVNGTACSTCPNDYPKSAGGQISVNKCYKTVTETATCSDEATPAGCASAQRNAATRNTCNWDSYKDGTGTQCTPKACTNTLKSVTASSGHYVNGTSCPSCPSGYPNSDSGNSGGVTACYSNDKSRAWSGKQNEPTLPTGCSKMTTNACSKPACTYKMYSNSAGNGDGAFHSGCQTNAEACTKTIASVEALAGNYVNGTACPTCTSASSSYPSSDGGAISSGKCYAKKTVTGTCTNAATPAGCASATFSAGTKTSCEWKDYADKTGKVCTPAACTNPVATVTASAGHYVSGTSCPACSGIESGAYPNSDGGTISSNSCYKSVTLTGKQVDGATPTNCASVVEWNTCNPKTCTYKDYYKDTDTPCTPENCTKTVKTVKAGAGYYVSGITCPACTNKPANSSYSGAGTTATNCPWTCNSAYGKTYDNQCVALCTAGISTLHAGDKVSVQLYDTKHTTPAIVIQNGDKMCYGNLAAGSGTNALNVTYKDATYHTVN